MGSHKYRKHKPPRRKSQGNKKLLIAIGFLTVVAIIIGAIYVFGQGSQSQGKVLLKTTMGDIVIELRNDMPVTSGNFRKLVQQGVYNGTIFHRVIADFMIQGGDPTGTGKATHQSLTFQTSSQATITTTEAQ